MNEAHLDLEILPQPDDTTCGPTCLHAIYRYYQDPIALASVIAEVEKFPDGGTLAVLLGCHALRSGYRATVYTYNLQIFDPTWFHPDVPDLAERMRRQMQHKHGKRLQLASRGYLEFLQLGGQIRFEDLTAGLIRKHLNRGIPILTGLSATYLYRTPREFGEQMVADDVRGEPAGHFVVLYGYNRDDRTVLVADPLRENPLGEAHTYSVGIDRLVGAILLGILSHDANFLIIEPRRRRGTAS